MTTPSNRQLRVAVTGGRNYKNQDYVSRALDVLLSTHDIACLIHGGASGADRLAANWAVWRDIGCVRVPAHWDQYGLSAGPRRNSEILKVHKPDIVIAFRGGAGTADMCRKTLKAWVPLWDLRDGPVTELPYTL